MGGERSMQGELNKCIYFQFISETLKRRHHMENLRLEGEDNINIYHKRMAPGKCRLDICGSERGHWWAFVNATMEL